MIYDEGFIKKPSKEDGCFYSDDDDGDDEGRIWKFGVNIDNL